MKNLEKYRKLVGAFVLMGGLMVALPVLASAAASTSSSGAYCVASASGSTTVQCFSTFGSSISYATGGLVNLSNANVARYVSPSELAGDTSSATAGPPPPSVVLAIDYSGSGYTGTSLAWTGTGCSATVGGANMPSSFNNKAVSVAAYSGCATTLFANANYGSPAYLIGVNGAVSDMGSFDDTASSQLFCNYYGCA